MPSPVSVTGPWLACTLLGAVSQALVGVILAASAIDDLATTLYVVVGGGCGTTRVASKIALLGNSRVSLSVQRGRLGPDCCHHVACSA